MERGVEAPGASSHGEVPPVAAASHSGVPQNGPRQEPPSAAAAAAGGGRTHSKRQLADCRIESHTIQRAASPKKKALDPLRYMPERAAFFALFTVAVQFEDEDGGPASVRRVFRTYKQFCALHTRMLKMYPKSNVPRELPSMRKKRYDNDYIERKREELNAYLTQVILVPEVRASKLLREFLEDTHLSDDSDDDDSSVSSKILEGLPGTIVTVRAGQSFSVSLALATPGDVASWQFITKKHNIGFSVSFNGQLVRPYAREESTSKAIKGFYRCAAPGTCTLDWDNTYTWSKSKVLVYWAEVEKRASQSTIATETSTTPLPAAASSSSSAGEHAPDKWRSFPTDLGVMGGVSPHEIDPEHRRSGYIAQTRNRAMYPRRIVNSSISLITKPFVSGASRTRNDEQFKSGSLIVERSVKFRGRHWYRKWFVLDTCKCMLRYYESEAAAQRGLSQSKLNLNNKHASLAITSSLAVDAAPTPYMLIVRTRKRCWKICAPTPAEYTAWEHAISTAIFSAQLSRESREEKKRRRKNGGGDESGDLSSDTAGPGRLTIPRQGPLDESPEENDDDDDGNGAKDEDESESDEDDDESEDDQRASEAESVTASVEFAKESDESLIRLAHVNEDDGVDTQCDEGVGAVMEVVSKPPTRRGDNLMPDLRHLPLIWKVVLVTALNVVLVTMRWVPTLLAVLLLVVVDWYLMLRFMNKSWRQRTVRANAGLKVD